jgi:hypothetical protein
VEEPCTGIGGLPDQADFRVVPAGGIADAYISGAGIARKRFITARASHGKTVPPQFRGHILQPVVDGHITNQWILRFGSRSFTGAGRLTAYPACGMLPLASNWHGADRAGTSQAGMEGTGRAGDEAVQGLLIRS